MTPEEVIDLLTTAAAFDRRTVGEADVIAWMAAVGDLDFADAQAAVVAHYTATTDWLMPAHVRTRVRHTRELRLAACPIPEPAPQLTDDPPAYRAELQVRLKLVADGTALPKALPRPGNGARPTSEYDQARGADRDPLRLAALQVRCPWATCGAPIGSACTTAGGRRLPGHGHDARLVAAGLADWAEVNGVQRAVLRGYEEPA
ncbi:hypothetical protein JOL79_11555 [Microbispora sp. RL4-1S]|uniref:DNA-binding phage zinc finger domain-containing protein n=1 Tax=Microbispora oryzae TaxID=2806554 RepID=A0A940WF90_9ACTN|nr:hypothetical protein [Microbispora oryzae]MBP2704450.1 hypothetical protein [Microbispora oryzae]